MIEDISCLIRRRGLALEEAEAITQAAMNETRGLKAEEMSRVKQLRADVEQLSKEIDERRALQARIAASSVLLPK